MAKNKKAVTKSEMSLNSPSSQPKEFDDLITSLKSGHAFERGTLRKTTTYDQGTKSKPLFASAEVISGAGGKIASTSSSSLNDQPLKASNGSIGSKSRDSLIGGMKTIQTTIAEEAAERLVELKKSPQKPNK